VINEEFAIKSAFFLS